MRVSTVRSVVRPAPTYCKGLAKSTRHRPALWHSLWTLNSHCNSLRRDEEVRRLAVESKRGLPETLTFVLDMKDNVWGSCWEMRFFFFVVVVVICTIWALCYVFRCIFARLLGKSHKIIKTEIRSDYFPQSLFFFSFYCWGRISEAWSTRAELK